MDDVSKWRACARPGLIALEGAYASLTPYSAEDSEDLFQITADPELWTYMPVGPFSGASELAAQLAHAEKALGWQTVVIRRKGEGTILGMASYMRIRGEHGSAEVGAVTFSKALQRTRIATEAIYLMARHVFDDLGYRRFEWKCNAANAASMRAAVRFGFTYEGTFRKDMVVKGQNRDTAWYSMLDSEWPTIKATFKAWLNPDNFDAEGMQRSSLTMPIG